MKDLLRFFIVAVLTFIISGNAFSNTNDKESKVKKMLDLQSNINGYRSATYLVDSISNFSKKDPKKKILNDPAVIAKLKSDIENAYIAEISKNLTDAELDYLILLQTSPMYKKYILLEKGFWSVKANQILNEKISLYQKNTK